MDEDTGPIEDWRVKLGEAQICTSLEADLEAGTWTFQSPPDCRVWAGIYAIVWIGEDIARSLPEEQKTEALLAVSVAKGKR